MLEKTRFAGLLAIVLAPLACSSTHGTTPAGPVDQWIHKDSPYYECPTQRAYLIGKDDSPLVLMTPAPTCLAGTSFEPRIWNLRYREGGADHFIVFDDSSPAFASELVIPVDRTLDGELRLYDESSKGGLSITELPDGTVRLHGTPITTRRCWSPARKDDEK